MNQVEFSGLEQLQEPGKIKGNDIYAVIESRPAPPNWRKLSQ